jgi:hypothetical protein
MFGTSLASPPPPPPAPPARRARALAALTGGLLVLYALVRVLFLILNLPLATRQPATEIARAFALGPRFDVTAIVFLNAPVLALLLFPLPAWRALARLRFGLILALNVPFLWLGVLDAEYFKFTGKRSGSDVLAFLGDASEQSLQLAGQYWYLVLASLAGAVAVGGVALAVERLLSPSFEANASRAVSLRPWWRGVRWRQEAALFLAGGAAAAMGLRGGFQRKPLTTTHAYVFEANVLNVLTLNTTLTVLHAGRHKGVPSVAYFPTLEAARQAWSEGSPIDGTSVRLVPEGERAWDLRPGKLLPPGGRFNVVVVIVESLGREYMASGNPWPGYTPFLDGLAREGLLFDHGFANGRRSIEAPWSVFAGIPSLMDEPYVSSAYKDNRLVAMSHVLRPLGYSTAYFHGGKNGTMFFDIFARMAGFERYVGMDEAPSSLRETAYDGTWGLFDGPFLGHVADVLAATREPFAAGVFTLSSHNPYTLPVGTEARYAAGTTQPIHKVIRYADDALGAFFERSAREPWYERTLFVITGDHTSTSEHESYQNDLGFNRVPILLYAPALRFHPGLSARVAQHTDISCTIYELVGASGAPTTPFCRSLLDPGFGGRAILHAGGTYNLVTPAWWTRRTPDGRHSVFTQAERGGWVASARPSGTLVTPGTAQFLSRALDAGVQSFGNGLNQNSLFDNPSSLPAP